VTATQIQALVMEPVQGETFPETYAAGSGVSVRGLAFDASSDEAAQFLLPRFPAYASTMVAKVLWYSRSGSTSGAVVWEVSFECVTPDSDTVSMESGLSWGTVNTGGGDTVSGTARALNVDSISCSNVDSLATSDLVFVRIRRKPGDTNDTMAGDAVLLGVELSWS
jgi:hypothetical protein